MKALDMACYRNNSIAHFPQRDPAPRERPGNNYLDDPPTTECLMTILPQPPCSTAPISTAMPCAIEVARGLSGADDGELFLEYSQTEALMFDNGRLKQATYDTSPGVWPARGQG